MNTRKNVRNMITASTMILALNSTPAMAGELDGPRQEVGSAVGMASGLGCAAAASWTGIFTWGIGPALAGLACSLIGNSVTQTIMSCTTDEQVRRADGDDGNCIKLAVGGTIGF